MWKKICVISLTLLGMLSISKSYVNYQTDAAGNAYSVGGNLTGRINIAPSGLTGSSYGLRKGDKLYVGIENPMNNSPLSFQLIEFHSNYTDYDTNIINEVDSNGNITCNGYNCTLKSAPSNTPVSAWLSLASESTSVPTTYANVWDSDMSYYIMSIIDKKILYFIYKSDKTNFNIIHSGVRNAANSQANDLKILAPRDLTNLRNYYMSSGNYAMNLLITESVVNSINNYLYPLSFIDRLYLSTGDLCFSDPYFIDNAWPANYNTGGTLPTNFYAQAIQSNGTDNDSYNRNFNNLSVMRPMTYIKVEDIVFSVSMPKVNSGIGAVTNHKKTVFSNIYTETQDYEPMKARVKDAVLTNTTQLFDIQNSDHKQISKVTKNANVYLNATAKAGSSSKGVNTVSVIVFDESDEFVYYKPIEAAKGNDLYQFDTTGIPVGKYKIGIVNEVYNETSYAAADSS